MPDPQKPLTVWRGAAVMVNIVLGAGVLTLPGLAYGAVGDAAVLVWLACGLLGAPLLAVLALLGRRWPSAGGLATILSHGFGATGYAVATMLFLGAVLLGLPAIAMTGGHYAAAILGGPAPAYAIILLGAATALNIMSSRVAARVNAWLAASLVAALVALLVAGWAATGPTLTDAFPAAGTLPAIGAAGAALMMVFFAFTGWEVAASLGGEFKSPHRDIPRAMAMSFAVVLALYLGLALVVNAAAIDGGFEAPFATILAQAFGDAGGWAIAGLAVALIFANLLGAIWAASRMVFSAAGEGLLPSGLRGDAAGVPRRAVAVTGAALVAVVCASGGGLVDLDTLLTLAGQNFLLLYAGACAVLVKVSPVPFERGLGLVCLALVAAIILLQSTAGLAYPAALALTGALLAHFGTAGPTLALRPLADGPAPTSE